MNKIKTLITVFAAMNISLATTSFAEDIQSDSHLKTFQDLSQQTIQGEIATGDAANFMGIGDMIRIGRSVWDIVTKGKATSDVKTNQVHVVPRSAKHWEDLATWMGPVSKSFHITKKNKMGLKVFDFHGKIIFNYNGSMNGQGAYLKNVSIHPTSVKVLWGWGLKAWVVMDEPINVGTKDRPVAGLQFHLKWQSDSPLTTASGSQSFFIRGDRSEVTVL